MFKTTAEDPLQIRQIRLSLVLNSLMTSHIIHIKSQVLTGAVKVSMTWSPISLTSPPGTLSLAHSAPATLAFFLSFQQVRRTLPQGLCTCHSFHLECSTSPLSLRVCSKVPFSVRLSLTTFPKTVKPPFLSLIQTSLQHSSSCDALCLLAYSSLSP